MMLLDHLKRVGKSIPAFASELGESENTIRKIAYGQRQPSLPLAVKIVAATAGAVTAAELVKTSPVVCGTCDVRADNPSVRAKRTRAERVAVCSVSGCNRRADDPAAGCCDVRDCPFAVKEAA